MKSFTDTKGREWAVEINATAIKRVRDLLGVNLLAIVEHKCELLARLHDDPILIVDVLYALCKPRADDMPITSEQFGEGFSGDVLTAGHEALLAELTDFFRDPQQRKNLRTLLGKMHAVTDAIQTAAGERLDGLDPQSLATSVLNSSGNSPASSASIPAPTLSAN